MLERDHIQPLLENWASQPLGLKELVVKGGSLQSGWYMQWSKLTKQLGCFGLKVKVKRAGCS